MSRLLLSKIVAILAFAGHFSSALPGSTSQQHEVQDKLGAVASESSVCSQIGVGLIKEGGNAADALVGTVFCVGVIGMYHSGVGGGGFMIVRGSNGSYEFIDFRETAPASFYQDIYNSNVNASLYGGLASGVPGELRGLEHLHKGYGKLPWSHIMQPAIKVARDGFKVTPDFVAQAKSAVAGQNNFLVEDPSFAIDFAPNGTLKGLNETITRKRYADTLETIAKYGADAFYTGPIANATIQALHAANGTTANGTGMTLEDLKNYTVAIRKPAQINYRNFKLTACSAPSSGTVALSVMKTVEGYQNFGEASALNISTHRLDEAIKFGYGERSNLGDPLFVPGLDEYQAEMLNETTAQRVSLRLETISWSMKTLNYWDSRSEARSKTPMCSRRATTTPAGLKVLKRKFSQKQRRLNQ